MDTFVYIIGAFGLPIILWVIFSDKELLKSNRFEIKYFYRFCYLTLAVNIYSLLHLFEMLLSSKGLVNGMLDVALSFIQNGVIVALGLFWLVRCLFGLLRRRLFHIVAHAVPPKRRLRCWYSSSASSRS